MKTITVYKDGKEFACKETRAKHLVDNEGYSYTQEIKASLKPKKRKAKVKVEADVVEVDSPFNDGNPINIDQGDESTEE